MKTSAICSVAILSLFGPANLVVGQQPPALGHAPKIVVSTLQPSTGSRLTVTSPAFKEGADIPYENTQYRGNIFPGLTWSKGPAGTKSYVVVVQGVSLSRPDTATSIHLTLYNIPANVTKLDTGLKTPPAGSSYGPNVHGLNEAYAGPHTHTAAKNAYHYQVLALDTVLQLDPKTDFDPLVSAMSGHVLATGDLSGLSAKDPEAKE